MSRTFRNYDADGDPYEDGRQKARGRRRPSRHKRDKTGVGDDTPTFGEANAEPRAQTDSQNEQADSEKLDEEDGDEIE